MIYPNITFEEFEKVYINKFDEYIPIDISFDEDYNVKGKVVVCITLFSPFKLHEAKRIFEMVVTPNQFYDLGNYLVAGGRAWKEHLVKQYHKIDLKNFENYDERDFSVNVDDIIKAALKKVGIQNSYYYAASINETHLQTIENVYETFNVRYHKLIDGNTIFIQPMKTKDEPGYLYIGEYGYELFPLTESGQLNNYLEFDLNGRINSY